MENKKSEERFILNQMIEGDKLAFQYFFDKYYSALCNMANVYLHNPNLSEEVVQEVFIYFWDKKNETHIESSINGYLIKSVKNRCLNFIRDEKNKTRILINLGSKETKIYDFAEIHTDEIFLKDTIQDSIDSLPEKCREIYLLAKEEELSYKEIAERLNISVKTVENQMGKALKTIRTRLKPFYKDFL